MKNGSVKIKNTSNAIRLLQYVTPYKKSCIITILSLFLATGAEILTPVILRRAMDDHLINGYFQFSGPEEKLSAVKDKTIKIGNNLFIRPDSLQNLTKVERNAAQTAGWIDNKEWSIVRVDSRELQIIVNRYPNLFVSENNQYAILNQDKKTLSLQERTALKSHDIAGLKVRSIQYFFLLILTFIFTIIQVYTASWISQRVMTDIRKELLSHIVGQSLAFLSRTPVGSLVSRVANDVETINDFFMDVTVSFLKNISIMVGVVVVLFFLNFQLASLSMLTLIPTAFLLIYFRKPMRESYRKVRACVSSVNAFLAERLNGMSTIQIFALENRSSNEFREDTGENLLSASLRQIQIMAIFRPLIGMISSIAVALTIWYASGLHRTGLVSLGILIAFVSLLRKFFDPVRDIAEKFNVLQSAMTGAERIFAMLDTDNRIPFPLQSASKTKVRSESSHGEIRFEHVDFSYIPNEPVLHDLSFTINPGETVAVVGATGAGKTTIANLITRFWDPQKGKILIGGQDIREFPLAELRKTVQQVQQDVFLFTGTVTHNIDLGMDFDIERIQEAAKLSRAEAFIQTLSDGYDSLITEGAGNISAGERQLIAFARIIAHNPDIIILDEATANVDTETESLIQEGMDKILADRTAIIIAHRLATIRRANRIIVLNHGKLIEEGTHQQLMEREGVYFNLYRLQFTD